MCTERWEHVNYISVIAYIIQPYNQRSYTMGTKGTKRKRVAHGINVLHGIVVCMNCIFLVCLEPVFMAIG